MLKQAVFAIVMLVALSALLIFVDQPRSVRYDCSIAEFHPDYPVEVREQCRKLRAGKGLTT